VGTWHDPDLGRPIAAPLERCAELLGVDLATILEAAANVEPYIRADGTRIGAWCSWNASSAQRRTAGGEAATSTVDGSPLSNVADASLITHESETAGYGELGYDGWRGANVGFADIVNRTAILKAIEEWDSMGRPAFLANYGFSQARRYFLVWRGQLYDSKAIVGVAHKYEFPAEGPLTTADISVARRPSSGNWRRSGSRSWPSTQRQARGDGTHRGSETS
jgi:hypothetical protein